MRSTYRPPAEPVRLSRDEKEARASVRGILYGIAASSAFWIAVTAPFIVAAVTR